MASGTTLHDPCAVSCITPRAPYAATYPMSGTSSVLPGRGTGYRATRRVVLNSGMVPPAASGMSSTDPTCHPMRCPVLTCGTALPAAYAMSGTDMGYGATRCW
eukprot:131417-Rhodomonas_salina.2